MAEAAAAVTATGIVALLTSGALVLSALLTLFVGYRVIRGPTTPDRVVALGQGFFVDVSLVLAIIGFLTTIAVARYVTDGDIIE